MAKVLVIESDSVFAAVLADRLHVAGHEVRRLNDGARAAVTAQDQHVDLVVLGESPSAGLGVVETLRTQPATRSVPILIMSDRNTPADRVVVCAGIAAHVVPSSRRWNLGFERSGSKVGSIRSHPRERR